MSDPREGARRRMFAIAIALSGDRARSRASSARNGCGAIAPMRLFAPGRDLGERHLLAFCRQRSRAGKSSSSAPPCFL
ncbi:MAG: hypothetical protein F6J93_31825 [Oscillatoria sp. SIO1A7]|nr:hypothetical protein [Oscillatoria sp. SIO1A7]